MNLNETRSENRHGCSLSAFSDNKVCPNAFNGSDKSQTDSFNFIDTFYIPEGNGTSWNAGLSYCYKHALIWLMNIFRAAFKWSIKTNCFIVTQLWSASPFSISSRCGPLFFRTRQTSLFRKFLVCHIERINPTAWVCQL